MKKTDLIISTAPLADLGEDPDDAGSQTEWRALQFAPSHHGQRLDQTLAQLVPEFSRSYLQQLVSAGAVELEGKPVLKPSARVRAGQAGRIELRPTPQSQAFLPEPMPLDIVHEDAHLCVIHKPAGLVVHPAAGHWRGTLLNGLLARDARAAALPRAGIVHRLDKDTSGLMVVARDRITMEALVRLIAAREVSRQYVALAHGPWTGPAQRQVDAPIGRDPRNRLRMAVVDPSQHPGKPAQTGFELLQNGANGCWIRATLQTGRTHQIRVHMAALGHPLVADALYDGAPAAGLQRQALHAYRLAFKHPASGAPMVFEAPPPPDMLAALDAWGLRYNGREWLECHVPGPPGVSRAPGVPPGLPPAQRTVRP